MIIKDSKIKVRNGEPQSGCHVFGKNHSGRVKAEWFIFYCKSLLVQLIYIIANKATFMDIDIAKFCINNKKRNPQSGFLFMLLF